MADLTELKSKVTALLALKAKLEAQEEVLLQEAKILKTELATYGFSSLAEAEASLEQAKLEVSEAFAKASSLLARLESSSFEEEPLQTKKAEEFTLDEF